MIREHFRNHTTTCKLSFDPDWLETHRVKYTIQMQCSFETMSVFAAANEGRIYTPIPNQPALTWPNTYDHVLAAPDVAGTWNRVACRTISSIQTFSSLQVLFLCVLMT